MVVVEMAAMDLGAMRHTLAAMVLVLVTIVIFALSWAVSIGLSSNGHTRGAFIQGGFRGNIAIVGLPILSGMMGDEALAIGVLMLAFTIPLYNILAVIALTVAAHEKGAVNWRKVGNGILTNPLIISVAVGALLAALPFSLPTFATRTAEHMGKMTFPLALLGVGAGISIESIRRRLSLTLIASVVKTVVVPLACVATGWALGLEPRMLAVLFVVGGAPTAVASFIMVKAMDGDAELAGGIVTASTLVSAFTITFGVLAMRSMGVL
jgi:predicted permease